MRFVLGRCSSLLLLLVSTHANAWQSSLDKLSSSSFDERDAHLLHMEHSLPQLGSDASSDDSDWSKKLATIAQSIATASEQSSDDDSFGHEASVWAFNHFRDEVAERVASEGASLLSPYGTAEIGLQVDMAGNFTGSEATLLSPLQDRKSFLTYSQLGISESDQGPVGSAGLGQRWMAGSWLLGYNAFIDRSARSGLQRGSVGTEAWGNFLRLSANYYYPLSSWRGGSSGVEQRMARGYDITSQSYLPFYRQLGFSLSYQQFLGDNIDLFNSGTLYHNPAAFSLGVSYTPVPLVTFSASHKASSDGETQDVFGLKLNYRFGASLQQMLDPANVAVVRSLRGSWLDRATRSEQPVYQYRQRKSLSVFLATPPWQLNPQESVQLVLQVHSANPIVKLLWQGDTQALSLTPPADNTSTSGWSVIMPAWDNTPGASNRYRLTVTLQDSKQQRVTSNEIVLALQPPMQLDQGEDDNQFDILAPGP
ncbi:YchO/YchP family invasin [Candidatus Pantoea multigeneris]|uniref:YchO/YchP family invasin n=1 Tax=Candidatus Pantoea multigeneris TaxID=2608357 RepID=A0ABX0RA34_9GAMM|nr:YchO/YchP family invasin [Pantoea multigeneris]NIF20110.1 YchO/YchP family invasin [Pantoea multigeneris]